MTAEEIAQKEYELKLRMYEDQQAKDKSESKGAGMAGGILGMLAAAGGAIPQMLKQPEEGYLKRAQQGQGTGAVLARQTASEAARRVAGNVQGSDLREGLRAADQITAEGAQRAGVVGAQESLAATGSLRGGVYNRRRAGQRFGAGIGMGAAGIGATLAAAKDQGPQEPAIEKPTGGLSPEIAAWVESSKPWFSNAPVPGAPMAPQTQLQAPGELQTEPQAPQGPYQLQQPFPVQSKPPMQYGAQQGVSQTLSRPSTTAPGSPQTQKTGGGSPTASSGQMGASEGAQASPEQGVPSAIARPTEQLLEATAKKTQAAAEYSMAVNVPTPFMYDPYWGSIATQLTDRELTEEQARGMLQIVGAPQEVIDTLVMHALAGQRNYDLDKAVKANALRQKAIKAGAMAGQGPNRK